MVLSELRVDNFRLMDQLSLQFHCGLNFFLGVNAAGKTSLLEAIYVLGRGKSFRSAGHADLAGRRDKTWSLFGRLRDGESEHRRGVGWVAQQGVSVRLDGEAVGVAEALRSMPVQILEPGMHRMLQDGPTYRRGFVDWGVFHVEPSFWPLWLRYRRAVRQRNQLLRNGAADRDLAVWEPEIAGTGEAIHRLRQQHLEQVSASVSVHLARILGEGDWAFELSPGWTKGQSLAETLALQRGADRRVMATQAGPHRGEVRVRAGSQAIKHRISRGQQKLLISAMVLAQSEAVGQATGRYPILLVDDFGAELAEQFQAGLLDAIQQYSGQSFVTAFSASKLIESVPDKAMFHVERGVVSAV